MKMALSDRPMNGAAQPSPMIGSLQAEERRGCWGTMKTRDIYFLISYFHLDLSCILHFISKSSLKLSIFLYSVHREYLLALTFNLLREHVFLEAFNQETETGSMGQRAERALRTSDPERQKIIGDHGIHGDGA